MSRTRHPLRPRTKFPDDILLVDDSQRLQFEKRPGLDVGHDSTNLKSRFCGLTLTVAATVRCGEKDREEPKQRNNRCPHSLAALQLRTEPRNGITQSLSASRRRTDNSKGVLTVTELTTMLRAIAGKGRESGSRRLWDP